MKSTTFSINCLFSVIVIFIGLPTLSGQHFTAKYKVHKEIGEIIMNSNIPTDLVAAAMESYTNYSLAHSDGISKYEFNTTIAANASIVVSTSHISKIVYYKDFKNQQTILIDELSGNNTGMQKASMSKNDWAISQDSSMLQNLKVIKATTVRNGNLITAYFAPEIAVADGPLDFQGLPGLIVKLINGIEVIELESIAFGNKSQEKWSIPSDLNIISEEEFNEYKKGKLSEYKENNTGFKH